MKKMAIALFATFVLASCGMKEMERQIDEQQNLLLAKNKEIVVLEDRIADLEAEIKANHKKMKKLESTIYQLKAEVIGLEDAEKKRQELLVEFEALEAENADLAAEKAKLTKKLGNKASDDVGQAMAAAKEHPEAFANPEGPKVIVVKEKSKTTVATQPGMPMPMPGMMPGAMPGMTPGMMPMAPGMPGVATFKPFPAAPLGKLYKPYPDSNLNIKLRGEYVKENTYMRIWVDGTQITFAGAVAKLVRQADGSQKYESLVPPGVDAYIPVDTMGPYVVKFQGCVMQANVCVPLSYSKIKEVKDVRKHGVSLKFAD